MLYALGGGWALLGGAISPLRAYALIAAPCAAPMLWYFLGFVRGAAGKSSATDAGEADAGLLLSAAGWLLILCALLFKHFAVLHAGADAYAFQASTPATPLCAGLGVLALLAGGILSWLSWRETLED